MREDQKLESTAKDAHTRVSISTVGGREFFPLAPRSHDIYPEEVAHALSQKCRFTGHTLEFYSVAQHCVLVSDALKRRFHRSMRPPAAEKATNLLTQLGTDP